MFMRIFCEKREAMLNPNQTEGEPLQKEKKIVGIVVIVV
jgi:hypothetical protein